MAPLFGPGAPAFLRALAADNSRAFFHAHREEYDRAVREPLEDLVDLAQERYGPGRVMRPNRDVRFSKDKSPYRIGATMYAGRVGGVYLELTAERLRVGGGLYDPARDQLARARDAIAEQPRAAAELHAAVDPLVSDGWELAGEPLRTAPRGFPRDHAEIELLRRKHLAALTRLPTGADRDEVLAAWGRVEPLLAWIEAHVGPTQHGPGR